MHETDFEHEHPSDFDLGGDIEGMEMFTLKSVGIDIGSSTTHLVFSRLTLRRKGASLSGKFIITEREVLYRSPIMLTPYVSGTQIDVEEIKSFVRHAYHHAGLDREAIDTGAVVITGEALKKENARPILEYFAQESGKFICASAGPHHEALLAAYGCGAVDLSKQNHSVVLNVDMGGGTTKLALIVDGVVEQTESINIGARLVAFDESGIVTRVEQAGALLMQQLGNEVAVSDPITDVLKEKLGALMAKTLVGVIERGVNTALANQLMETQPFSDYPGLDAIDNIVFSGGVSEYIYGRDKQAYGDLGPILGEQIRDWLQGLPQGKVSEPPEGIRSTVIGAGEYTMQASGNTSYITESSVLPVYALKVVRVPIDTEGPVEQALMNAFTKFDLSGFAAELALSLSVTGSIDYHSLRRLAEGIANVVHESQQYPLYLVLDQDIAKSLGGILKEEIKIANEIIAIDGIDVSDLDFIDIGAPLGFTEVIPVTIKSLLFPASKVT